MQPCAARGACRSLYRSVAVVRWDLSPSPYRRGEPRMRVSPIDQSEWPHTAAEHNSNQHVCA